MLSEFKAFLIKQNALALAIGVVIGAAMGDVVKGIVDDIIMPIVGFAAPAGAWKNMTMDVGPVRFLVGDLASRLIGFVIVAFVVWQLAKWFLKPGPEAPTRPCPFCRMPLDPAATRCAHCTSQLGQGERPVDAMEIREPVRPPYQS